jgi:aryl-alcohol dehydrogenase-like predicted oxidoreductase
MNDVDELRAISAVGFGCYRVTRGVAEHHAALVRALELGCALIDTASNYGDGKSEQLVGDVLAAHPRHEPFVVTKVGYLSPSTQRALVEVGVDSRLFRPLSAESRYSLDPSVIRAQIGLSQTRLRRGQIDAVLLHNPEHLLELASQGTDDPTFEAAIVEAFGVLEEAVAAGAIRYYGVSSNLLPTAPPEGRNSLRRLLELAVLAERNHHFRIVEFPFNVIERQAALPDASGLSLIDRVREAGCVSLANRPLNALQGEAAIRLATYDDVSAGHPDRFDELAESVQQRLTALDEPYAVADFPVMRFLRDNRHGIEHPDMVEDVFNRHLYPFINRLWEADAPAGVRSMVSSLHASARTHARRELSRRSMHVRTELTALGLIPDDDRSLAINAVDFGLRAGIDHVLVGMRNTGYVDSLRELLAPTSTSMPHRVTPTPLVRASSAPSPSRAVG